MRKFIMLICALFLSACSESNDVATKMQITTQPLTAEESWNMILSHHKIYHTNLKQFLHKPDTVVPFPGNAEMISMFNKEQLTNADIEHYHNIFITELYNANTLLRFDNLFKQYIIPELKQKTNKYLVPFLSSWNTQLPEKLEIVYSTDYSSYYNPPTDESAVIVFGVNNPSFVATNPFDDKEKIFGLVFHEFVHILIEEPIIRKYDVTQDLKERIVDLICYEFIKRPVRKDFENSFANAYITPEAIKTDLPGTVEKMMTDYKALQAK